MCFAWACESTTRSHDTTPSGASITVGSASQAAAELGGSLGQRQGDQVVSSTSAQVLPQVGISGVLYWVVDRPMPMFGQGVSLSLADVVVRQVQPGALVLGIVAESGPVTVNGQRGNVFRPGQAAKLSYRP